MKRGIALILAATVWACGERVDELGPYVQQLKKMDGYNGTLHQYGQYLKNPNLERQARDIREVIQKYSDDMEAFGQIKDKTIKAGHNSLKRALVRALKKLVEPDFPTFTVSAQKQVREIEWAVNNHFNALEKAWKSAGQPEPFPLKWPE